MKKKLFFGFIMLVFLLSLPTVGEAQTTPRVKMRTKSIQEQPLQKAPSKPVVITIMSGKKAKVLIPGKYPDSPARLATIPRSRGDISRIASGVRVKPAEPNREGTGRYYLMGVALGTPAGIYQIQLQDRNGRWLTVSPDQVQIRIMTPKPQQLAQKAIVPAQVKPPTAISNIRSSQRPQPPAATQPQHLAQKALVSAPTQQPTTLTKRDPSAYPDLIITRVDFDNPYPTPEGDTNISVTIKNVGVGNAAIPPSAFIWNVNVPVINGPDLVHGIAWPPQSSGPLNIAPGQTWTSSRPFTRPGSAGIGTYNIKVTVDPGRRVLESRKNNNEYTILYTVNPTPKPDLTVTDFQAHPPTEDYFDIVYYISNLGQEEANFTLGKTVYRVDSVPSIPGRFPKLTTASQFPITVKANRGFGTTARIYMSSLSGLGSIFEITITADPDNEIDESDESNNQATITVNLGPAGDPPDLIITEVFTDPENPDSSHMYHLRVKVQNMGEGDAQFGSGAFLVEAVDCPAGDYAYTGINILPGEIRMGHLIASTDLYVPGSHTCTFRVGSRGNVDFQESDTTNNEFTYTWTVSQ